ncbi:MAG: SAM-dependent chlorinase/fluorinase [Chloroflexi bacterium OHK40]
MIITFLTDFGASEAYVGVMKGVALGICPGATLVDITHAVPAQDVRAGALLLPEYVPFFPPASVHVAVVDPGVGSARRGLAVEVTIGGASRFLVGPDNGLFWPLLARADAFSAVELAEPRFWLPRVSSTFHGRDVFTPVAAHLARGVALAELGPPATGLVQLQLPVTRREDGAIHGEIIVVDHFGNCISNIRAEELRELGDPGQLHVWVAGRSLGPIRRTFADVAPGAPLALISSSGRVEVALRDGDIARGLGIGLGAEVVVAAVGSRSSRDPAMPEVAGS